MYIGRITYLECNRISKLELKHESIFRLLEIISNLNDLDITEIHLFKEV